MASAIVADGPSSVSQNDHTAELSNGGVVSVDNNHGNDNNNNQWCLPSFFDVTQMKLTDEKKETKEETCFSPAFGPQQTTEELIPATLQEERIRDATREFTDVKFCPYTEPGVDPVFAVVNARHILICRPNATKGRKGYDVIQAIVDTNPDCKTYCCAWSKDATTGSPLLVVGGENATLRIYDILQGKLIRTLTGLGGRLNDLEICPANPFILATGAADDRITIWNLHPDNAKQPIAMVLAGTGGHRESLLSVSWHLTGKYLVSGSEDKVVKVWYLLDSTYPPSRKTKIIQYPIFSTSAIHSGHVECVKFCGDLILSKAYEEDFIVLWKIEGFSSSSPPPPNKAHSLEDTLTTSYSDFVPGPKLEPSATTPWAPFTRLIQFWTPDCDHLYMRFGLYYPLPTSKFQHPILSFCNSKSKVFFWDLARFNAYTTYIDAARIPEYRKIRPGEYKDSDEEEKGEYDNDETITSLVSRPPKPSWLSMVRPKSKRKTAKLSKSVTRPRNLDFPSMSTPMSTPMSTSIPRSVSPTSTSMSAHTVSTGTNANSNLGTTPLSPLASQGPVDARNIFTTEELTKSRRSWDEMYSTTWKDRWRKLNAHKVITVEKYTFTGRQVGWDNGGAWCVVAGSENLVVVLGR